MFERINFNELTANTFVKDALTLIGYPEELNIVSHINDANEICYEIYYEKEFRRNKDKHLLRLSKREFIGFMILGMSIAGYEVLRINPEIYNDRIIYESIASIVSYNNIKRNRRRK